MERLRLGNDLRIGRLTVIEIAVSGVREQLRQYIPDSGQEHTANGDDRLLVATPSLEPAVAFLAFRVLVGLNDSVGNLNEKGLEEGDEQSCSSLLSA